MEVVAAGGESNEVSSNVAVVETLPKNDVSDCNNMMTDKEVTDVEVVVIDDERETTGKALSSSPSNTVGKSSIETPQPVLVKHHQQQHNHQQQQHQQQHHHHHSDVVLFNSPKMVLEKLKNDGIRKSKLTLDQLIILSLFAGIFKGLACSLSLLIAGNVPKLEEENPGLQRLLSGAVFPISLILIVFTGSELFTGNVLVLLVGLFSRKWRAKKFLIQYTQFSKNLFVSYVFNCLGAFIFAYFFIYLPQPCCSAHWITFIQNMAVSKTQKSFGNLLLLGIMCNMLVTIAVYNANAATSAGGKIIAIWFPIMTFVALGFEHSIANAYFIPLGMLYGANVSVYDFLIVNMLPVTIGNILGGAIINACLLYYVHDYRARHHRAVFNLVEKLWRKARSKSESSNKSNYNLELQEASTIV